MKREINRVEKYFLLLTKIVPTTFNEFKILLIPSKCTENITKSTHIPKWKSQHIKVGYKVQPKPAPSSVENPVTKIKHPPKKNQSDVLFNLG